MEDMSILEGFLYAFAVVFGFGLAIAATCVAMVVAMRLMDMINALSERLPAALDRYINRDEIVIEEYDAYLMQARVAHLYPKPDRVRLARKGEPGARAWRRMAQNMRDAS